MIQIDIPNRGQYTIRHIVFDVNGTLATGGELIDGVAQLLNELRQHVEIHMLTADTHGRQQSIDAQLGLAARIITQGAMEKAEIVLELGAETVIAIGNGANDAEMFKAAALSVAVLGDEGLAVDTFLQADVVVKHIHDAINLLLHPDRLRATLRR